MVGRCLIVANQTLGGEALDRSVQDCTNRDISEFYVVVPMTPVEHETTAWTGGYGLGDRVSAEQASAALEDQARQREADLEEARRRAQWRLDLMIEKIQSMGAEANGEIGIDDPFDATKTALERQEPFDEVIVSTLPSGMSRWLKMDLPSRVARLTDAPVTTIEAEG